MISLAPRRGARDTVPFDDEAGKFFDGVRYGSQTAHHRPLAEQDARQFAGGKRRDIGELESHHGPFDAVDRIDNGRALLGAVGEGIPDSDLVVELAGEFIERPDGEHPALTVPDEHRPHPLALVVPGERSRQLLAVRKTAVREAAIGGIAQLRFRISHGDEKLGERTHADRRQTALQADDSRRGRMRENIAYVSGADALGCERQNTCFARRVHCTLRRRRRSRGRRRSRAGVHRHSHDEGRAPYRGAQTDVQLVHG